MEYRLHVNIVSKILLIGNVVFSIFFLFIELINIIFTMRNIILRLYITTYLLHIAILVIFSYIINHGKLHFKNHPMNNIIVLKYPFLMIR